jgi:hypothetical protein
MTSVSIESFASLSAPAVQSEGNVLANRLLVTDTQHQEAASRRVLPAGQRQR